MISEVRARGIHFLAVAIGWIAIIAAFIGTLVIDREIRNGGRTDLAVIGSSDLFFLAPVLSAALVGSAIAVRRPRHPVGWLFLSLALLIVLSGVFEAYAVYGLIVRPLSVPLAGIAAVVSDKEFFFWLLVPTLILLYVPSGQLDGRAGRLTAIAAVASCAVGFVAGLLAPYEGFLSPSAHAENPLAIQGLAEVFRIVRWIAILAIHACLAAACLMLLARFRFAWGSRRQQLRSMALAAVIFPVLVGGASLSAILGQEELLPLFAGSFIAVVPIAAGIAIERDHLFDIDRLISRSLTYSLLSVFLVSCYAAIVVVVGQTLSQIGGGTEISVALATLGTISLAGPARRYLQTALDKRFNRREFAALSTIRRFVRQPPSTISVEDALRQALGDQSIRVAYWIDDRGQWVSEDGQPASNANKVRLIERRGRAIARISFESSQEMERLLDLVLPEAGPEIENARLRASITLQLREVKESRSRILAAQQEERRRLERNLHDGAQQRLLAVAMQLRASEVSQDAGRQSAVIDNAVDQLRLAVKELRDLANGLHPAALSDGGVVAALEELASQTPILTLRDITRERFAPEVEEAAWFIACEAVANAVKHAAATNVWISAVPEGGWLQVAVEDNGIGGADCLGHGLKGIADRADSLGGRLTLTSPTGQGTIVRAELPCG